MHQTFIPFILKFFITNIAFSFIIGMVLVRLNNGRKESGQKFSNFELLLYALGLGPIFTVLILFFLLLVLPGHGSLFYVVLVTAAFAALAVFGRKVPGQLLLELKTRLAETKRARLMFIAGITMLFTGISMIFIGNFPLLPLDGHDVLVYANLGKVYHHRKAVEYSGYVEHMPNGFFFSGSPKPSFSLLLTWELMVNDCLFPTRTQEAAVVEKAFVETVAETEEQVPPWRWLDDLWFRSITFYYTLLLLGIQAMWLYRKNKYLALLGIPAMLAGLRFFIMMFTYHLDAYRLFFLVCSWIFLGYGVKKKDLLSIGLLGIFSGFTAFTHLIGAVIAGLNGAVFFFCLEKSIKDKIKYSLLVLALIIAFGGLHYLLEAFFGSHWGFLTYFNK